MNVHTELTPTSSTAFRDVSEDPDIYSRQIDHIRRESYHIDRTVPSRLEVSADHDHANGLTFGNHVALL